MQTSVCSSVCLLLCVARKLLFCFSFPGAKRKAGALSTAIDVRLHQQAPSNVQAIAALHSSMQQHQHQHQQLFLFAAFVEGRC